MRAIFEQPAQRLLREVIGPILPTEAAREDALKETVVTVLERRPSMAKGEVFPWLVTIARNKALDRRRRMKTEGRYFALLVAELEHTEAAVPDPESQTAAAQARRDSRERVEAVLARMNPRYAQALRLRLLEERGREECAATLDVKVGTFDVLFFRACKQFRALFVDTYGADGGIP